MKTTDYSFYLFVQLRMLYAPSILPYDIMHAEDLKEFENYLESEFNKDTQPEYECMEAYLKHKFKPHRNTIYKFARKCDATGEGMNQGYVVTDGLLNFKHEEDAIAHLKTLQMEGSEGLKGEDLLQFYYDIDECYYTEWNEVDEDAWYECDNEDGIDPKLVEAEF